MDNLEIYNRVRSVPPEALRPITAGRLKGKSDVNPMWRIKALTEQFGPCGTGWKYEVEKLWLEASGGAEVAAFALIGLYVRIEGQWSEKIPGIGGSMFVASEKNGPYTSDECYKMALTDALSVACKALGMAADVYWDKDPGKYSTGVSPTPEALSAPPPVIRCEVCGAEIKRVKMQDGKILTAQQVAEKIRQKCGRVLCKACQEAEHAAAI